MWRKKKNIIMEAKPVTQEKKPAPDFNTYPEKLTQTYTCPKCNHEYRFDPLDSRKFNCEAGGGSEYYGYYVCKNMSRCCHHYEQIIKKPCPNCGTEIDPSTLDRHKSECIAHICSTCDEHTYTWHYEHNSYWLKKIGPKVIKHGKVYKCIPCYKDDILIAALTKVAEKL